MLKSENEMNREELLARIRRLESALADARRPYADNKCDCCGEIYIKSHYDDKICYACYITCCQQKETGAWIQGSSCPARRKPHVTSA